MKISEDKYDELQVKSTSLQLELEGEKTENATFVQKIALFEKQCEDATTSAASSSLSRFSQQEVKELVIKTNQEHYDLITELFQTMNDIYETDIAFGQMSIVLKEWVEKREKASKAYDTILDQQ